VFGLNAFIRMIDPRTAEEFERAKRKLADFELNCRIVHPG